MKSRTILIGLMTMILSCPLFAAFSVDELHAASKAAVADFLRMNAEHAAHLVGYKTWKSGDDAMVKVYVNHEGHAMDFNYHCHKHGSDIECHAQ